MDTPPEKYEPGDAGEEGPQGREGETGDRGEQGEPGEDGIQGIPGIKVRAQKLSHVRFRFIDQEGAVCPKK